jgi:hypothetical protein
VVYRFAKVEQPKNLERGETSTGRLEEPIRRTSRLHQKAGIDCSTDSCQTQCLEALLLEKAQTSTSAAAPRPALPPPLPPPPAPIVAPFLQLHHHSFHRTSAVPCILLSCPVDANIVIPPHCIAILFLKPPFLPLHHRPKHLLRRSTRQTHTYRRLQRWQER